MIIFASEDVGLGNSNALLVANNVFAAVEKIGLPECRINLVHGVVFLAQCKKDRRAYDALETAMQDIKNFGNLPIPLKLRNAVTKLMKESNYGEGYEMYSKESCLPDKIKNQKYL
jgi:putative ATPase